MLEKLEKISNKIINKVKFFISKDNFTKTKIALVIILSGLLSIACEYTIFRRWNTEFI